jgi:hypothetical protein
MLVAMPGQQYSGRELRTMPREAGFTEIEVQTDIWLLQHCHGPQAILKIWGGAVIGSRFPALISRTSLG